MIDEAVECFGRILREIAKRERVVVVTDSLEWLRESLGPLGIEGEVYAFETPINDTWVRDYGLITLVDETGKPEMLDFTFNGWGMKFAANHDNQVSRRLAETALPGIPIYHLTTVLEGGSIESDGSVLMTTSGCLLAPNRNEYRTEYDAIGDLSPIFRPRHFHFITSGELVGDDTDGHVDTLARFAPGNRIVYVKCYDEKDEHYESLSKMEAELKDFVNSENERYELVPLPLPTAIYDKDNGERLPATYANYYYVKGAILLPVYNVSTDKEAIETMRRAFGPEGYEIVPVDCCALIRQHGSLHCSTMQYPSSVSLRTEKLTRIN
jgi:agmatine/peptidylarginine deiminase